VQPIHTVAKTVCSLLVFLAVFGSVITSLNAQGGKASLQGFIQDAAAASVPGVNVTLTNIQTGVAQTTTSNDNGFYTFTFLNPGSYSISASKEGFKTEKHESFVLTVDQQANLNFSLSIGSVNEEVNVLGTAELLNTTSAALGQVIRERAILELPLTGRNPAQLVLLTAGTVDVLATGAGVLQSYTTFPTQSGASVNGGRQGSTFYLLDGVFNMDNYHLLAAPFPNADATQEFRVVGNNFEA